jgi:hypothetical protein
MQAPPSAMSFLVEELPRFTMMSDPRSSAAQGVMLSQNHGPARDVSGWLSWDLAEPSANACTCFQGGGFP